MALKGTTKIELTNVNTGQKEVIEKDNLVTDAVASALGNPYACLLKSSYNSSYYAGNILPLCPNLFGGILLYEDAIPENANQLYAQASNKLVGYSSNNVNELTDLMRGSLNQTESGALEDNSGYRFVFDFGTAQGNGTISAVGLTSKWGGIAGYGSEEYKNTQSPSVYSQKTENMSLSSAYALMHLLRYNETDGTAMSVYVSSQGIIAVHKFQLYTKNWKLTNPMNIFDLAQLVETQIIETEVFAGTTVSGTTLYYNFCDGGDGYIWGFEHSANAAGNNEGKASVNWIKIKTDDLSFEEGTWEIDAQLYYMGGHVNNPETYAKAYNAVSNSAVLDGYLYCFNYTRTGLYKIKLSNITDVAFIEHPDKTVPVVTPNGASSSGIYYCYGIANLMTIGNKVCMWNGWLNKDTIVRNAYKASTYSGYEENLSDGWYTGISGSYPFRNAEGVYGVNFGVFRLSFAGFTYRYQQGTIPDFRGKVLLNSPYLATINNLPTPVQKTADKTMKITYILREEM